MAFPSAVVEDGVNKVLSYISTKLDDKASQGFATVPLNDCGPLMSTVHPRSQYCKIGRKKQHIRKNISQLDLTCITHAYLTCHVTFF